MSIVNLIPDEHAARLSTWAELEKPVATELLERTVYLGLGSNLGDRLGMLQRAVDALRVLAGVTVTRCSPVYETDPWGKTDQDRFLNCVAEIRTRLDPATLLDAVLGIERALGRERGERNGPRSIDVDILLYGLEVVDRPGLRIPHPFLAERNFVLQPLRDLAGGQAHPVLGLSIEELARRCPDPGGAEKTDLQIR